MNNCQNSIRLGVRRWSLRLLLMGGLGLTMALSVTANASQDPPFRAPTTTPAPQRGPVTLDIHTLVNGVTSTVVELPAVADAYIASSRPTQNFGSGALFLGYNLDDNYGAERMLLRFDFSSIPSDVVVYNARLRLYLITGSPFGDTLMDTIVRRLASNWSEQTIAWNAEPTWASIRGESSVGATAGWYEWNITDLTTAWVQDTLANQGVEVSGDERVQQRERAFYSHETTTAFYPRLTVSYSVVSDNLPPLVTVTPLAAYSGREFTVAWSGGDQGLAGLRSMDVQVQVDSGVWTDWQSAVTFRTATFVGVGGHTYAFRARGVDNAGNLETFGTAEAQTMVDIRPPEVRIAPLPASVTADPFPVAWSGDDHGGSGIQFYDVRYRLSGGSWVAWQTHTLAASAPFFALADGVYEFEARGADNAGQVELFTGLSEARTLRDVEAPFVLPYLWLPIIRR